MQLHTEAHHTQHYTKGDKLKPVIMMQAPVFSLSGYGAHARDIAMALYNSQKYSISILPTGWGGTSMTSNLDIETMEALEFMCSVPQPKTDNFIFVHMGLPTEFKRVAKINIGVTAGLESTSIPESWVGPSNSMDAIIVPSTFVKELFKTNGINVPIYVVGEGVDINIFKPETTDKEKRVFKFDTEFNFISSGQWLLGSLGDDRKGIGKLIKVFCETFADREEVGLILKTSTSNVSSPDYYFTKQRIKAIKKDIKFPKIHLVHGDLTEQEMRDLYYCSNAFVSLTSGESWFRPLAEAVACDIPVLVTGWSGHMDYIKKDMATVFDYKLAEVPKSVYSTDVFLPGMNWAYPDLDSVKNKLRRCVNNYPIAKERAVKLGKDFRNNFSKKITDAKLVDVFDLVIGKEKSDLLTNVSNIII